MAKVEEQKSEIQRLDERQRAIKSAALENVTKARDACVQRFGEGLPTYTYCSHSSSKVSESPRMLVKNIATEQER